MAKVATNISIDEDIKPKAQAMLAEFGLDLSTAVNMFLRQMLREKAIPFEFRQEIPNADTLAAMSEVEEMEKHPELAKTESHSFSRHGNDIGGNERPDMIGMSGYLLEVFEKTE